MCGFKILRVLTGMTWGAALVISWSCANAPVPHDQQATKDPPSPGKKRFIIGSCATVELDTIGRHWEFVYADSSQFGCRTQYGCPSDGRLKWMPVFTLQVLDPEAYMHPNGTADDSVLERYTPKAEMIAGTKWAQLLLGNCHGQKQPVVDTVRTERYEFLVVTDSACVPQAEWETAGQVMVRAYAFVDGKQLKVDFYDVRENRATAGRTMRELLHTIRVLK